MKVCNKCNVEKSLEEFSNLKSSKDGLSYLCKVCNNIKGKEWRVNNPIKAKENSKKGRLINLDKSKQYIKEWSVKPSNKDRIKLSRDKYIKNNPAKIRESSRNYTQKNKDKANAQTAKHRSAKKVNTPKVLEKREFAKITEFYTNAKKMELINNILYHVDHIIPLIHDNISGLNVPWNLQILPAKENLSKGNKFDGTYENESWRKDIKKE